ncbi:MAG: hypothetical protein DMD59_00990 [Gemmatimonadetes bacterium]|nr:MAG: hypothetical protein DMD59_00990 [Gemmatimonadota bacterium]
MILALALSLAVQGSDPPVSVKINHDQFSSGDHARVYVETAQDGYLVVLHADPDGRIRVLFPTDPRDDDFIRGGRRFEVRGRSDRDAFQVEGDEGSGTVLAAVSSDPLNFDATLVRVPVRVRLLQRVLQSLLRSVLGLLWRIWLSVRLRIRLRLHLPDSDLSSASVRVRQLRQTVRHHADTRDAGEPRPAGIVPGAPPDRTQRSAADSESRDRLPRSARGAAPVQQPTEQAQHLTRVERWGGERRQLASGASLIRR